MGHERLGQAVVADCVAIVKMFAAYRLHGCAGWGFGFVKGKGDVAVAAVECVFAGRAEDEVAVATPVQQQDGLFVFVNDSF